MHTVLFSGTFCRVRRSSLPRGKFTYHHGALDCPSRRERRPPRAAPLSGLPDAKPAPRMRRKHIRPIGGPQDHVDLRQSSRRAVRVRVRRDSPHGARQRQTCEGIYDNTKIQCVTLSSGTSPKSSPAEQKFGSQPIKNAFPNYSPGLDPNDHKVPFLSRDAENYGIQNMW
jgi:hypothetical protein